MANPSVVQNTGNDGPGAVQIHTIAATFAGKMAAGNGMVVFGTQSNFAGVAPDIELTDSAGNFSSAVSTDEQNSIISGGAATQDMWVKTNVVGDPTTADTFTQGFTGGASVNDYMAVYGVEVGNVVSGAAIGFKGNTQNALAHGTNNINSGAGIVVGAGQVPALMVALAFNTSEADSTTPTPTPGTGMTLLANTWAFSAAKNLACVATQLITVAGTYQAIFNQASAVAEDITCQAVIFQGIGSGGGSTSVGSEHANRGVDRGVNRGVT